MVETTTTTCDDVTYLTERMGRFANFLDVLTLKDPNLAEWAAWCRTISVPLAIAGIRSGALGPDLKQAASCLTPQSRAIWCQRALEAKSLEYEFNLANFNHYEVERVCRYLELLAASAAV